MTIRKQYKGDLPEKATWTMLTELENGFWPTIYYQDEYNQYDKVAVRLNASDFAVPYEKFAECVANLLPFSFQGIVYTVLGEYLKEDTNFELVLFDGYSDSFGGRAINKQISIRRELRK